MSGAGKPLVHMRTHAVASAKTKCTSNPIPIPLHHEQNSKDACSGGSSDSGSGSGSSAIWDAAGAAASSLGAYATGTVAPALAEVGGVMQQHVAPSSVSRSLFLLVDGAGLKHTCIVLPCLPL